MTIFYQQMRLPPIIANSFSLNDYAEADSLLMEWHIIRFLTRLDTITSVHKIKILILSGANDHITNGVRKERDVDSDERCNQMHYKIYSTKAGNFLQISKEFIVIS